VVGHFDMRGGGSGVGGAAAHRPLQTLAGGEVIGVEFVWHIATGTPQSGAGSDGIFRPPKFGAG